MVEKDYFIRTLNTFLQKLSEYISGGTSAEVSEEMIRDFYTELFQKSRDFFVESDFNTSISAFNEDCVCEKAKALADIFYIETMKSTKEKKVSFAKKSLEMFRYYEQKSSVFDLSVFNRINNLTQIIENE
ncbi:MAG: hypothetical protein LBS01_11770 [Prevotellaceae bacterium]|jgi:hypothetical protein|nr:hypothetical protein [Prevotellaceae bacterium]